MTDTASTPTIPDIPMTITVPDRATYELFLLLDREQRLIRRLTEELKAEVDTFAEQLKEALAYGVLPLRPSHIEERLRNIEKATRKAETAADILRTLPHTGQLVDRVLSRPAGVTLHVAVDAG